MKIFKNYLFYYSVSFYFINQNKKDFDFIGLDYYRYLEIKYSIYSAQKTRLPAVIFKIILFGIGFEFCTHDKD